MRAFGVVETEVVTDPDLGFFTILICFQIHLLVLHCSPQPLYEQIVAIPPFPIHADPDSVLLQEPGEGLTGELGTPWSVLNISGLPFLSASFRASTQKPASRVFDSRQESTYRLYQSMMATQIKESSGHGDIGDVCCPHLVRPCYF